MAITHSTHEAPTQEVALPSALARINSNVLDDAILKKLVDPDVYYALAQCRATGVPMDREFANALAKSIREWAQSKGCIGYSHWFSPMRGPIHGEKLETFVGVDFATDRLIINLSGSELFQTETDGSSFPNGGLRDTHQAAAYIGWDTGSPPFVYRETLYIPSAFVTWNGEALDQKTPLLRADMAVNEQSVRLLALLGDTVTREVVCNVGWEQEFFLIDRDKYLARPDLVATGRTLLGAAPLRGQEMSTNYFARLSPQGQPLYRRGAGEDVGARDLDPLHPQRGGPGTARDFADLQPGQPRGGHQCARHGRAPRPRLRPRVRHPVSRETVRRDQRHRQAQQLGAEHRHRRQSVRAGRDRGREPALHRLLRGLAARRQQARRSAALRRVDRRQRPPAGRPGSAARDHHAPSRREPRSPCEGGRRRRRLLRIRNPAQGDRDRRAGRGRARQSGGPQPHRAVPVVRQPVRVPRRRRQPAYRVPADHGQRGHGGEPEAYVRRDRFRQARRPGHPRDHPGERGGAVQRRRLLGRALRARRKGRADPS